MRKHALVLIFSIPLLLEAPLLAGVVVGVETKELGKPGAAAEKGEMAFEGKRLRVQTDPRMAMIYRGDGPRRELLAIDHSQKNFVRITEESLQGVASQMDAAMRQMQEQLKDLPPEQRAMVEQVMKQQGMGGAMQAKEPVVEVRKTSQQQTFSGYPCVKYEVVQDGKKIQEVWVTGWANMEAMEEARDLFQDMAEFYRQAFQGPLRAMQMSRSYLEEWEKLEGFPIVTREFDGGSPTRETTVLSIEKASLSESLFNPPQGYKETKMGEQPGR